MSGTLVPRDASAPTLGLAAIHYRSGATEAAEAVCRHLIALGRDQAEAAHLLGVLLLDRAAPTEAAIWLRRAVDLMPANAQSWDNLARACLDAQRPRDAIAAAEAAIRLDGASADRLVNLGSARLDAGDPDGAIAHLRAAVVLAPMLPPARFHLGRALIRSGRTVEAEAELRLVLAVAPPDRRGMVIDLLSQVLTAQGRYREALGLLDDHLERDPEAHRTRWNRALVRLILGDYARGWADYEARWLVDAHTPAPPGHAVLDPTQVAGRRVLVVSEQGMGDCIQFVRYATLLADRGAEVWLSVPRDLVWVCRTLRGVRGVVASHDPVPKPDLVTSMLSLPSAFATRLDSVPAWPRYLAVPPHARAAWDGRVRAGAGTQVGLAWVGSAASASRSSIPLRLLAPVIDRSGAGSALAFHALARDVSAEDDALLRTMPAIRRHDGLIRDFADTAAILAELDLVITIDTAVAHLAGALGVPTWVMLPFDPDWRWLTDRDDSPWYPGMRLFRQTAPGAWPSVVERVVDALTGWRSMRRGRVGG